MVNKEFREKFDQEYQNLCISEQIADLNWEKEDRLSAKYLRESEYIKQKQSQKK